MLYACNVNSENTQKLISEFPDLYGENFSFYCDDGWFDLIYTLSQNISKELKLLPDKICEFSVAQVKEKFAGLRFYVHLNITQDEMKPLAAPIMALINKAERDSFFICEKCGSKEDVQQRSGTSNSWVQSICANCDAIEYVIK